ncbi:hypothetical protein JOB18_041531 [Solea senegalensis]|uniref:Microtubule-associated protein 9 n=1 Tax=Solea senegalensis TaxID=28829 RepID=A0AAV6T1B9_SOLSE|nr:microtubule-associated protein 9-like [Solea senegalensis]KAG7523196.1 hypothetical protein JOB18_041531 [Solea senegalensis]
MADAFKSGKSRATVNDVEVLNDDGICGESHKYLNTQRISRSSETDHQSCSSDFSEVEAEFRDELHNFELSDDDDTEKGAFMTTHKIHSSSEADLEAEDEEDSVREPLKSTKNRAGVFQTGRSRGRTKHFQLSDSFLNTQSIRNHLNDDHQSLSDYFNEVEDEPPKSTKNTTDALKAGNCNDEELSYDQGKSSLNPQRISSSSESDHHPCSSDFSEAEDEFMDELHKSIKHRADAFKAVKSIITMNTAVLSDDDDDTNKESFLKAPSICSPSGVDRYSDSEDDSEKKLLESTKNRVRNAFKGRKCRARISYAELSGEEGRKRDSEHHSASEASHYSHSDEDVDHSVEEICKSSINTADVQIAGKSRARMKDLELSDDDSSKEDSFLKCQRTSSAKAGNHSRSGVFNEVDDDCVNELLKSRISKADVLKAGKSRAKNEPVSEINKAHLSIYQSCNDIERPVDEETMKQSFQNMQKIHSPSEADLYPDSDEDEYVSVTEPPKSKNRVGAFKTQKSRARTEDVELLDEVAFLEMQRNSSPLEKSSQNVMSDPSIGGHNTIKTRHLSRLDFKLVPLADSAAEREPPSPATQVAEKFLEEAVTQDLDRSRTPSIHSAHTSNPTAVRSCSPGFHQPFEEFNEDLDSHSVHCVAQFSHNQERTSDARISSSHPEINKIETTKNQSIKSKFQRTCSMKIEPKYLGTLKLLDQKVLQTESEPLTVNVLRAAVYHRWLKMKNEKSRENMQTKKEEEEIKKKTEQAKKEAAVASYEAWGKRKASLKAEAKQQQVMRRKEQQASRRRKAEKSQSAKREFEKWKQEHDHLLKERYREEKEAENDLKLKINQEKCEKTRSAQKAFEKWKKEHDHLQKEKCIKEKEEENNLTLKKQKEWLEKQRNNESNFRNWCEKKQAMTKCQDFKRKQAEEERMREKEERDKKALEAYEDWLARKDLKHRSEEKLKTANFYH